MPNEIYHKSNWGNANAEGFGDVYFDAAATNKLYNHSDYYENSNGTDKILRDLPNKASITLTPTAYSNGSLNTVIPPYQVLPTELYDGNIKSAVNGGTWTDNGDGTFTVTGNGSPNIGIGVRDWDAEYLQLNKTYRISAEGQNVSLAVYNSSFQLLKSGESSIDVTITTIQTKIYISPTDGTTATYSNVSVKEIQEADFDFSRGSSATRVNEKGLIEDVQILSGELVQNGDFEEIGSELVTNGNFDTDTDWTKGTGWTIADGSASYDASGTSALTSASTSIVSGKIYRLKFKITTSGFARLNFTTDGSQSLFQPNGNSLNNFADGEYTFYLSAQNNSTALKIFAYNVSGGTSFSIDNVSVKEVGQNWTLTQATVEDGKLLLSTTDGSYTAATQTLGTIGKLYRITLDVADIVGQISVAMGGGTDVDITTNGTHTIEIISASTTFEIKRKFGITNVSATIDNISVVEVTDDTDIPRIDYTSGQGALLLEPQRTNLITYSEDFTGWGFTSASKSLDNSIVSPDGGSGVQKLTAASGDSFHFASINATLSGKQSFSVFLKKGTVSQASMFLSESGNNGGIFDLENGLVESVTGLNVVGEIINYGNGWFRCILNHTSTNDLSNSVRIGINNGALNSFNAVGDEAIYIWGAQVEAGSYATSYIVSNSGSTTTRSADVANNSGNADLINSTEGVLYAEFSALADDQSYRYITLSDGTNSNYVIIRYYNIANKISAFIENTLGVQGSTSHSFSPSETITDFHKVAFKWKANDFALWIDGTEVSTQSSGTTFSSNVLNKLQFNEGDGSGNNFYGKTKALAVFKEALTDAELESLTSWVSFVEMATDLEYTIE